MKTRGGGLWSSTLTSRSPSSPEVIPPSSSPDTFFPPRLTYLGRYRLNLPLPLPLPSPSLSSSSASSFSSSPLSPLTDLLPPLPPLPRPLKLRRVSQHKDRYFPVSPSVGSSPAVCRIRTSFDRCALGSGHVGGLVAFLPDDDVKLNNLKVYFFNGAA